MWRLRWQKLGSLLGLLAILLGTLAPTVSQSVAAHHRLGHALNEHCSASTDNDDGASHSADHHWQTCAWCGLLAHAPMLPGASVPFAATLTIVRVPVAPARDDVRAPLTHTAAQPRAPPAFS